MNRLYLHQPVYDGLAILKSHLDFKHHFRLDRHFHLFAVEYIDLSADDYVLNPDTGLAYFFKILLDPNDYNVPYEVVRSIASLWLGRDILAPMGALTLCSPEPLQGALTVVGRVGGLESVESGE